MRFSVVHQAVILISSIRDFSNDPSGEYAKNQLAAKASWNPIASQIVYFSAREPLLDNTKTVWIPGEQFPLIRDLVEFAAMQEDWSAILNSDIVLAPHFLLVEAKLKARHASCASSWRYNFDPALGLQSGVFDDLGLDIFVACPAVWQRVHGFIDPRLTVNAGYWDTVMLSLFSTFYDGGFYNFTRSRVVFHPRHNGRLYGPGVDHTTVQMFGEAKMPFNFL